MTGFVLKIIAVVAMALDHIGYFIHPYSPELYYIFRIIGRLAMPLYCFLIAEGYRKTSNPYKYMLRLLVAALLSELPFNLCFHGELIHFGSTNVMFTLLFGLFAVFAADRLTKADKFKAIAVIPILLMLCIAQLLGTDYGFYGVLLIIAFRYTPYDTLPGKLFNSIWLLLFASRNVMVYGATFILHRLFTAIPFLNSFAENVVASPVTNWGYIQLFAALSAILLLFYKGKYGFSTESKVLRKTVQYTFYLFYPVHLMIIWLIFKVII